MVRHNGYAILEEMQWAKQKQAGFTIVELLIVVVVIAILAAITIIAYNGIRDRAIQSKIRTDISQLEKAIVAARNNRGGVALRTITNSVGTGGSCWGQATGTDLAALATTNGCWTNYNSALNLISEASHINIRGLIDPWGRPYYIDENEGESCNMDWIGYYSNPFTTGQTMTRVREVPRVGAC